MVDGFSALAAITGAFGAGTTVRRAFMGSIGFGRCGIAGVVPRYKDDQF